MPFTPSRSYPTISILRLFIFALIIVASCSSCSTFIGKAYDNTTARYNSYFLAKEKMKEVDVALKAKQKDDYHKILSIHYSCPDSTFGKSQSAALEDVFKYASWSVRWHKRSKWADNNYILIGKVRHYQHNYKDGLETFRFVNATSDNPRERHEALIQLMKFFTDFNEFDNVKYVIEFMDQEQGFTRKNRRDYLVAKAAYHQHYEEYKKTHELLDSAITLCRRKHDKAKLSFINGQISEYLKEEAGETKMQLAFDADEQAYKNYHRTIKSNPKYELWFNARLNMMRVSKHSDLKDVEKARAYFRKMLADQKNTEYKDRIYYEFASFERKHKAYGNAEGYYKKSAKNATSNQRQKAYTYLALGEMYYDDQQRFEDAKLYYDSAIAILPRDHKGYGKIYRRQRILKEFVEHITTVRCEDSLQKLAKMDTAQLSKFLEDYIVKEEKRLNDEAKRLAKQAKRNASGNGQDLFKTDFMGTGTNPNGTGAPNTPAGFNPTQQVAQFYFYNKSLSEQGKIEFQQKWGRRKLEDFWRLSTKETSGADDFTQPSPQDTSKTKNTDGSQPSVQNKEPKEEEIKVNKADLYAIIPSTPEKLAVSHKKVEASIFRLGKIYSQHLGEPDNAIKSLERLINDYPESENVPEAHYMIYLISKGKDSLKMDMHKNILLEKYPQSLYAKIIKNPNYLAESKVLNKQIMARYKVAYESYLNKNFKEADSLFTLIQTDYPDNEFNPKIDLIRAMMKAREGKKEAYRGDLEAYMAEYKTGTYHDYAQRLMDKLEGRKPKPVASDSLSGQTPDQMPPAPNPPVNPSNGNNNNVPEGMDAMPEEIRKIYEEQMRNRKGGMMTPQNSPEPSQMPNPNSENTTPQTPTPAVPNGANPSAGSGTQQQQTNPPAVVPQTTPSAQPTPTPINPSPPAPQTPENQKQQEQMENKKGF